MMAQRRLRALAAQLEQRSGQGLLRHAAAGYSEAVAHDLGEEELQALRGAGQGDARNKPRGDELQGYGIIGEQPPVFDSGSPAGFDAALEFYNGNGFCVVQALSPEEIARLNAATDIWIRERGAEIDFPGQGQLYYPLVSFPEVDFVTQHPKVLPLVGAIFGGIENARFIEFNWRGWPSTNPQTTPKAMPFRKMVMLFRFVCCPSR